MERMTFGIEIETIGKTREEVARAIQSVVGGTVRHVGTPRCYDPWEVTDRKGRAWKVVADSSLNAEFNKRAEIVSPILEYEDIPELQRVVRAVRRAGAKVDRSCGIHIHIGARPFTAQKLAILAKMVYKHEDLIFEALKVRRNRRESYAKPLEDAFIRRLESRKPRTMDELNEAWYGYLNREPSHYDSTRYHGLNLHNVWYRGTIEFRYFNGTLHAGKIKAYIQFCVALAKKALESRSASAKKRTLNRETAKYDFRVFLLRLGMIGDEFKTARKHLLANLAGSAAWKNTHPQNRAA